MPDAQGEGRPGSKSTPAPVAPSRPISDKGAKERIARALRSESEMHYSARNVMMTEMRKRRYQDKKVDIPEAYQQTAQEVRLPILSDTIDLMIAISDDAPWRVHVDPYDETLTAYRNSSLREKWSEALVREVEQKLGRSVTSMVRANQIADGLGVLKVLYDPDVWRDLPTARSMFKKKVDDLGEDEIKDLDGAQETAKRGGLPISFVDVDPMNYHPIYGQDGQVDAVIEVMERPIRSVLAKYGSKIRWLEGEGIVPVGPLGEAYPYHGFDTQHDTRPHVTVWEYWDRQDTMVFVDDVLVHSAHHGMGEVPYFHCFAKPTPDRNPERHSRPPTYKQRWLLDLLDRFWTMMSNAGYLFCYPTPVTTTPLGQDVPLGDDARPITPEFEVGKHMTLYEGQEFKFITPPSEHLELMGRLIEQAMRMHEVSSGLGPAIRGVGGGDQAGYAINQLIQASMMTLHPGIQQYDLMMARAIRYVWKLIEKRIKTGVPIWGDKPKTTPGEKSEPGETKKKWLLLGPSDIKGYYRVKVETKPLVDQMRISKGSFAAQMVKGKLLDRRRAIEEYLGYPDPDAVMDAIWVDEALESGPLHDKAVEVAMKKAGVMPAPPMPMMRDPLGGPMQGNEGATLGGPPGMGPGAGMPLNPNAPPMPQPTEQQMAEAGLAGNGGRPAGGDRMAPQPMPVPLQRG
jgi:hypothetical protein